MSDMLSIQQKTVPANFGPLKEANGNAKITGPCGDTMELYLRIQDETIVAATYTTDGCASSHACGSTAAAIIQGAPIQAAAAISSADILAMAGPIAESESHCALLAENTLKAALADYERQNYQKNRSGEKAEAAMRSILNPKPPLIVSCRGKDGKDNALVVVYAGNCSFDPPMLMLGIVPSRHSYSLVKESGCFVVNITPTWMKDIYDYVGSHSGRDEDKLTICKARIKEADTIPAPLLIDCPVNIECSVVDSIKTGSHEMFIGKILKVHADKELVNEKGAVDWKKIPIL